MRHKSMARMGLAMALALVGLAAAGDALALPDTGYRITYFDYNEATGTYQPVGKEVLACNGHYTHSGYETDNYAEEDTPCNPDSPPPTTVCQGISDDVCHYYTYPHTP